MKKKIKITGLPQKKSGGAFRTFGVQTPPNRDTVSRKKGFSDNRSTAEIKVNKTLKPTEKENATLEAELGETVVTSLNKDGLPEFYRILGKRHSQGGTPLNLPEDSFIFSRDNAMKIKNQGILDYFGKKGKGKKGFTPADVSKSFNINTYREILADPNTDKLSKETAELMIKNYTKKLGALALVQESTKGFDDGIPSIAMPFLDSIGINPMSFLESENGPEQAAMGAMGAMYGGEMKLGGTVKKLQQFKTGGSTSALKKFDEGGPVKLKKGDRVIFDPQSQRYMILDKKGRNKGFLNLPAGVNAGTQADPNLKPKVVSSSKPTNKQNIPDGVQKFDPSRDDYDESKVKEGDYIIKNGRWYKVNGRTVTPYDGTKIEDLDQRLMGDSGDLREAYGRLEQKINGDSDLRAAILTRYKEDIKKAKAKGILKQSDIDEAAGYSDEKIIENYLEAEKQIMIINAQKGDIGAADTKDKWDKGVDSETGLPKSYVAAAKELGFKPKSIAETFAFQINYNGIETLKKDPKYEKSLIDFKQSQHGLDDEGKGMSTNKKISDADGWWGNTTVGQALVYKPTETGLDMSEVEDLEPEADVDHLPATLPNPYEYTPYWKQDLRNIGMAGYGLASVRKGEPIRQNAFYEEKNPVFADFRGGASRLNANTQAGLQGAQAYGASAAQTGAQFANMQKNNVAGVLGLQDQEYKQNLGTANAWEARHEAGRNEANRYNGIMNKTYWDETELANNNFKNEKMANMANLVAAINTADTNRGMTQSMNIMRDDWRVDPRTGFTERKFNPVQITPKNPVNNNSTFDLAKEYQSSVAGMTWPEATALAKADLGQSNAVQDMPEGYVNPAAYGYPGQHS